MTTGTMTDRKAQYADIFATECQQAYPLVDAFLQRCGYGVGPRLLEAARVLACPIKKHAPHWQHGRVLYAAARKYLDTATEFVSILDIGTAKGFSALCLQWALADSGKSGQVTTVDVVSPLSTQPRNTVAEIDRPMTLFEILEPWPEASTIELVQSTGMEWLERHPGRVHIAFVDGKHSGSVVLREGRLLAARQQTGDLAIFDDVHIPDVSVAVHSLHQDYKIEYLEVLPHRHYAIGVRR